MKQIQFTSGCPNDCAYCYEPTELKFYDPIIPKDKEIRILDMNFVANPKHIEILEGLPSKKSYELVCGIDFRLLTQKTANLLYSRNFIKMRWAWDYTFYSQRKHQKIWRMFKKAGYKSEELRVFMIVNWKIPYVDCCRKLDLLKIWNVEVVDCCFDGGYKLAKPIFWIPEHIKKFRSMARKHNQMIIHKIDPEY